MHFVVAISYGEFVLRLMLHLLIQADKYNLFYHRGGPGVKGIFPERTKFSPSETDVGGDCGIVQKRRRLFVQTAVSQILYPALVLCYNMYEGMWF